MRLIHTVTNELTGRVARIYRDVENNVFLIRLWEGGVENVNASNEQSTKSDAIDTAQAMVAHLPKGLLISAEEADKMATDEAIPFALLPDELALTNAALTYYGARGIPAGRLRAAAIYAMAHGQDVTVACAAVEAEFRLNDAIRTIYRATSRR